VEPDLPHDGHVQVMDQCHFQALGALVEKLVVEGLNVQEKGVTVVLSCLSTLKK
jgi:hypothetical protein